MQIVAIEFSILAGSIGMVELDLCKKTLIALRIFLIQFSEFDDSKGLPDKSQHNERNL